MPDTDDDVDVEKVPVAKWLGLTMGAVALIWIGSIAAVIAYYNYESDKVVTTSEAVGQFGDAFGVVNALFSGLAFAGVIVAIFIQRKELEYQRIELKETRLQTKRIADENKRQADQIDMQNAFQGREAIRNQFFRMLESWQEMVQSTDWSRYHQGDAFTYRGREAYAKVEEKLTQDIATYTAATTPREYIGEVVEKAVNSYDLFYKEYLWILSQYLRLFYHCLKFVHRSNLEVTEKRELISILRAHLSQSELRIIMLNGLTDRGKKMYQYIEAYDLLQNYDPRNMLNRRLFLAYPRRFKQLRQETGIVQDIIPVEVNGPRLPIYAHELDAEFMPDEDENIPTLA